MKIVWHAPDLGEQDWIRDLFHGFVDGEINDLDCTCYENDALHVVSSNVRPLGSYDAYFAELRARGNKVMLFHLSDEWFSGGYAVYRHFDAVLRTYHTWLADAPGIFTLPLGYPNGTPRTETPRSAAERPLLWSFTGVVKSSRHEALKAFDGLEPSFVSVRKKSKTPGGGLSLSQFNKMLDDSVFLPCPMGSATLDTWRVFEALEHGCIPIVERRAFIDYHRTVLGDDHPIPTFRTWSEARAFCEAMSKDKPALVALQTKTFNWWTAHRATLRQRMATEVIDRSYSEELGTFAVQSRNHSKFYFTALRIVELLRHQTIRTTLRRLSHPFGPLLRIMREAKWN